MAQEVDNRVVEIELDNKQFEKEAYATLKTLQKLQNSIDTDGLSKGLSAIDKSTRAISLDGLAESLSFVNRRFSVLGEIGTTVLHRLTNEAITAGQKMLQALSINPKKDGFSEYEQQINSVKVIMANLGNSVTMQQVNDALDELNEYADLTIYNFGQMTDAIGKFTAAGVGLEDATTSIKGLANLAAGAGVNNTRLAGAYIQISQALQAGVIKLQDWNSLQQAGLANPEFQKRLQENAIALGTLNGYVDNFRDSLKDGWLTNDVFIKTMYQAADATNEWGRRLTAAATEVTTVSQLIDTLKEGLGTEWATSFKYIIGDFEEAKEVLTAISDLFGQLIGKSGATRNSLLASWKESGGRQSFLVILRNLMYTVLGLAAPFKIAMQNLFPPMTGKRLAEITKGIADFTEKLILDKDTIYKVANVLTFLLSPLKLVTKVIKAGIPILKLLFSMILNGLVALANLGRNIPQLIGKFVEFLGEARKVSILESGRKIILGFVKVLLSIGPAIRNAVQNIAQMPIVGVILERFIYYGNKLLDSLVWALDKLANIDFSSITSHFKDFVKQLKTFASSSTKINTGFAALDKFLNVGLTIFKLLAGGIALAIASITKFGTAIKDIITSSTIFEGIERAFGRFKALFDWLTGNLSSVDLSTIINIDADKLDELKEKVESTIEYIKNILLNADWNKIFVMGFGAAIALSIFKISSSLENISTGINNLTKGMGDLLKSISARINPNKTKSKLMEFAKAIAILTASIFLLATLPDDQLDKAINALGRLSIIVIVATGLLNAIDIGVSKAKVSSRRISTSAGALIGFAGGILMLVGALKLLEHVDLKKKKITEEKIKVLGVLVLGLGTISVLMSRLGGNKMNRSALFLLSFSYAVGNIVKTLVSLEKIDLKGAESQVYALSALMVAFGTMAALAGRFRLSSALGFIVLGALVNFMMPTFQQIAKIDFRQFAKNIEEVKYTLAALGGALLLLTLLTIATKKGGGLETVGKGVIGIAIGLLLMTQAFKVISATLNSGLYNGWATATLFGMIVAIGSVVVLLAALNKDNGLNHATGTLLSLAAVIAVAASSLIGLSIFADGKMLLGAVSLAGILAGIAGTLYILTKFDENQVKNIAFSMIAIIGTLVTIAVSLAALQKYDVAHLSLTAFALIGTAAAIGAGLWALNKFTDDANGLLKSAGALFGATLSLTIIARALKELTTDFDWDAMWKSAVTMGALFAVITVLMTKFNQGSVASGLAMVVVAGGLILVAISLEKLASVNIWGLIAAAVAISAIIGVIAVASRVLGQAPQSWVVLILLAIDLLAVAAAAGAFAWAIDTIVDSIIKLATAIGMYLAQGVTNGMSEAVGEVGEGAKKMGLAAIDALAKATGVESPSWKGALIGNFVGIGFCNGIAEQVDNAQNAGFELGDITIRAIETVCEDSEEELYDSGKGLIDSLTDGMTDAFPALDGVIEDLTDKFTQVTGLSDLLNIATGNVADLNDIWGLAFGKSDEDPIEKMIDDYLPDLTSGFDGLSSSSGGSTGALKTFTDTIVKIPDITKESADTMNEFVKAYMKGMDAVTDPSYIDGLENTFNFFLERNYDVWAQTDKGIQKIEEEEEEIERLAKEALEAGVTFDEEAKRAEFRLRDINQAFLDLKKTLVDTISSQMDIFSEFNKKTELSSEQIIKNMRSQVEGVKEWAANLQILATKGIDQGLLQKLAEMGPQSYEYVNAFVKMSADQMTEANKLYAESVMLPDAAANQVLAGYMYAGLNAAVGFQQGIDEGSDAAAQSAADMGMEALEALQTALDEHSPSKKTYEMGMNLIYGMIQGIDDYDELLMEQMLTLGQIIIVEFANGMLDREYVPISAARKIVNSVLQEFRDSYDRFIYVGRMLMNGLVIGMMDMAGVVGETAAGIALSAYEAAALAVEVNSPSKKMMTLGRYMDEGFIIGLLNYADQVRYAAEEVAYTATDIMQDAITTMTDDINDTDIRPTISPVLDLTDITPKAKQLDTMMSKSLAGQINAQMSNHYVGGTEEGMSEADEEGKIIFNQYNTSPKALNRSEIYRHTNNQLAMLKNARIPRVGLY